MKETLTKEEKEIDEIIEETRKSLELEEYEKTLPLNKKVFELKIKTILLQGIAKSEVYDKLESNPKEYIKTMEEWLKSTQEEARKIILTDFPTTPSFQTTIQEIRSEQANKLLYITGVVKSKSEITVITTRIDRECKECGHTRTDNYELGQETKKYVLCPQCYRTTKTHKYMKNTKEHKKDIFYITLEEAPEENTTGELGRIPILFEEHLASPEIAQKIIRGTKITIAGTLQLVSHTTKYNQNVEHYLIKSYGIQIIGEEQQKIQMNQEVMNKIQEIRQNNLSMVEYWAKNLYKNIEGETKIKESIIVQLVGNSQIKKGNKKTRGDIHIILFGDTGSAKSTFLKLTQAYALKSRFASGGSSSAVGITAGIIKDELIGSWTCEAGAMPLAHKGILCLDEVDKLDEEDIKKMHEGLEQQCYDDKTEVLTKEGWKFFKDLTKKDLLITLKNGKITYEKPKLFINNHYEGDLFYIQTRRIDLVITPNHNLYASIYHQGKEYYPFQLCQIKEIYNKRMKMKKNGLWEGQEKKYFELPQIIKYKNQARIPTMIAQKRIIMDDWLEFMGYFLSEGSVHYINRIPYQIYLSQSEEANKEICNKMRACIKKIGYEVRQHKRKKDFCICNKQLASYLSQFGKVKEKHAPDFIKKLSSRQIKIFLEALIDGDGNRAKTCTSYITTSKKLADDFQELCLKIGKSAQINAIKYHEGNIGGRILKPTGQIYSISILEKNEPQINHNGYKQIIRRHYSGRIYCVEIPNHILYVRRNGKPIWCGNTITTDKGNVHVTMPCQTSVLGAGNPKYGMFDLYKNIYEQIEFPPAFLNRFDLIWVMIDKPETEKDKRIAQKIIRNLSGTEEEEDIKLFKQYLTIAKNIQVKMNPSIEQEIITWYENIRKRSNMEEKSIRLNARSVETIMRLMFAHARGELRAVISSEDFIWAKEIFLESIKLIATDLITGSIDTQIISTGVSHSENKIINLILQSIAESPHKELTWQDIRNIVDAKVPDYLIDKLLAKMKHSGDIFESRNGIYNKI